MDNKRRLPEGLELTYLGMYALGTEYNASNAPVMPTIEELEAEGWEKYELTREGHSCIAYYQKESRQIRWNVDGLRALERTTNVGALKEKLGTTGVSFQIICKLTDQDVLLGEEEKTFVNELDMRANGYEASTSDAITFTKDSLSKEGLHTAQSGAVYPFRIRVNAVGEDLVPGADEITLIDELGSSLILDSASIRILNTDTNDELEQSRWKAELVSGQNGSSTLRLTLPDNLPLTITYNTFVNAAPGQTVSITNTARWEGYSAPADSDVQDNNFSYNASGTAGGEAIPSFVLTKVDQADVNLKLEGAVFDVQKVKTYDRVSSQFVEVADAGTVTQTTDRDGTARFEDLEYNTVYRLTETKAPDGYMLDNTQVYFAIAKSVGGTMADPQYPVFPENVHVWYINAEYRYTAYNHKGEAEVEKKFRNKDNTDIAQGAEPNDSYRFGIFKDLEASEGPLQILTIQYKNGTVSYIRDGVTVNVPRFVNLDLGFTYYIYELDDNDSPIQGGSMASVSGQTFTISYEGNDQAVTIDAENSSKVTVTNKTEVFLLPNSGGKGIYRYLAGGMLLTGVALLLLYYKKKRRGRLKSV